MKINPLPWWRTDRYELAGANDGPDLGVAELWGPQGAALVQLWPDGRTSPGWGLTEDKGEGPGFMKRYLRGDFNPKRILYGYDRGTWNFAWIMRSSRMIAIDIDGKNGGFDHASELGFLPQTCAETSKSGNGYHLFYLVDDEWSMTEGFGKYPDAISIVQGVDIRGAGCIYHYPSQRWNGASPVKLPEHLSQRLLTRAQQRKQTLADINKVLELEPFEVAILHSELLAELKKPIQTGKRNVTLFAIGAKLKAAQVERWQEALHARAIQVGLDAGEADKLVTNIENYGG